MNTNFANFYPKFLHKTLIISFLITGVHQVFSQEHRIKFGTQAPISHAIGYEYEFKNQMTAGMQVGILASPYGEMFNGMMKKWGMTEEMKVLLNEAFTYAWVFQPSVGYSFNSKYHVEVFGQHFYSSSSKVPVGAIIDYFGAAIDPKTVEDFPLETNIKLIGRLYHVGFQVERRFQFKNPQWEFRLGVGLSSNIRTRNTLEIKQFGSVQIDQETIDDITTQVNDEIRTTYLKYAHIPVINLMFVRRLGKVSE